jgi:hypothetical protein
MPIPRSTRVVVATATLAALSACSGGSQFSPSVQQQSFVQHSLTQQATEPKIPSLEALQPSKTKPVPLIFAADVGNAAVYAYENSGTNQSPIWKLSGSPLEQPTALWVDGASDLYVGDNSGFIYEYNTPTSSAPPGKPNFTYNNLGYSLTHIAVCGKYLYAANIVSGSLGATVTVFKIGTEDPIATISQPQYTEGAGYGITCNAATGNFYFGYDVSYSGPGEVDEYPADGSGKPTTLNTDPVFLQGLTFNHGDTTFVLGDAYNPKGAAIEFWGVKGKKASHAIIADWVAEPIGFAYEKGDKALWDADTGNNALYRFSPSKGTLLNTITSVGSGKTFSSVTDVALSPPDHD